MFTQILNTILWLWEICQLPLILLFDSDERKPNSSNFGLWLIFSLLILLVLAVKYSILFKNTVSFFLFKLDATCQKYPVLKQISSLCKIFYTQVQAYCYYLNSLIVSYKNTAVSLVVKIIKSLLRNK